MRHGDGAPYGGGVAHGRNLMASVLHSIYRLDVSGSFHVPARGPVLLVANHMGLIDGPLLLGAAPRPVHTLAKHELFTGPLARALNWAGQIRVEYEQPDRTSLKQATAALARGWAVGIFPEGHRGRGDVRQIRRGAAYLLATAPLGTPFVPVAILGTRLTGRPKGWVPGPRAHLAVVFGEPITPVPADPTRDADVTALSHTVHTALAEHIHTAVLRTGLELPHDDVSGDPD
jgi:1-acyl-sn-glycerol-3-phosphate acyltransferase